MRALLCFDVVDEPLATAGTESECNRDSGQRAAGTVPAGTVDYEFAPDG